MTAAGSGPSLAAAGCRSEASLRRSAGPWICAALIGAAVLAASCAVDRTGPSAPSTADAALANHVYAVLNADPVYFYRHVNVRVDHGVASLSGYVWSAEALYHARMVARSVPGVTAVVTSQLELEREGLDNGRSSY